MPTQSTNNNTEAKLPTGDIKVFIDAFNKDFDKKLKSLLEIQQNYKNVYADAIKITTPKVGPWPNDPKVVTIGDLFKYTFPDIESDNIVKPPDPVYGADNTNVSGWQRDLKYNKDKKIGTMYDTIFRGLRLYKDIKNYKELKPGITNPSLWSPGQYYFDVFMNKMLSPYGPLKEPKDDDGLSDFAKTHGGSVSVSFFDPSGEVEISKHNDPVNPKLDYYQFSDVLINGRNGIKNEMSITGIDINLGDNDTIAPESFASLQTQYRSGILSDLLQDPKFNKKRGYIEDSPSGSPSTFTGNYEHILLYKAFVQAGDNYKAVVLPLRNPEPEPPPQTPSTVLAKTLEPTAIGEVQFKFNVEKIDTFIVVGGTVSPPLELTIVPNDGTEYIMDIFNDMDYLGDEYNEGTYQGTEEELFQLQPGESYPVPDIESLNSLKGFDPNSPNESLSTDSTSKYKISKDKDANARAIISAAKSAGVTNKFAIVAILAITSKESGFVPISEASYATTPAARIIKIFGARGYSATEWDVIKKDPVKFFNIVYGNKYGNGSSDGYKYRGRGFNQITFKGNYEQYGKDTGLDLVNDPDLLNTVDAAAKCLVAYFKRGIKSAGSDKRSLYNFTDINSFKNLDDATGAMVHANAGWGKSHREILADSTGGRRKAFANAGPLYNTYQSAIA